MDNTSKQIWRECCRMCNVEFAKRDTEEYYRVLELFKERMEDIKLQEMKEDNPSLYKWTMCCKKLKIKPYEAKKGTDNYNKVKELFSQS